MAMITDYDCWKVDEAHVTVEMVIANVTQNAATQSPSSPKSFRRFPADRRPCHSALANAIMTDRKVWPKKTITELKPLLSSICD